MIFCFGGSLKTYTKCVCLEGVCVGQIDMYPFKESMQVVINLGDKYKLSSIVLVSSSQRQVVYGYFNN